MALGARKICLSWYSHRKMCIHIYNIHYNTLALKIRRAIACFCFFLIYEFALVMGSVCLPIISIDQCHWSPSDIKYISIDYHSCTGRETTRRGFMLLNFHHNCSFTLTKIWPIIMDQLRPNNSSLVEFLESVMKEVCDLGDLKHKQPSQSEDSFFHFFVHMGKNIRSLFPKSSFRSNCIWMWIHVYISIMKICESPLK